MALAPNPSFPSQVVIGFLKLKRESEREEDEEDGEEERDEQEKGRERQRDEDDEQGKDDLLNLKRRGRDGEVMVFNMVFV